MQVKVELVGDVREELPTSNEMRQEIQKAIENVIEGYKPKSPFYADKYGHICFQTPFDREVGLDLADAHLFVRDTAHGEQIKVGLRPEGLQLLKQLVNGEAKV